MARLVYGLQQSLDGFVDHMALGPPGADVFRHFQEQVGGAAGLLYGRRTYEIMRYWDEDQPGWDAQDHAFAAAWRSRPKWVASTSLAAVGPNATLIGGDVGSFAAQLKRDHAGEIHVAGPVLARTLSDLGLIDEYRLYFRPVVLGNGSPYFAGTTPALRLLGTDRISADIVRLTYGPG